MPKRCTRADDELLLQLLRLRARKSSAEIGAMYGIPATQVRTMTNRVRADDLDWSIKPVPKAKYPGERAADVLAGYGWSA
jgi:hypothetical protein